MLEEINNIKTRKKDLRSFGITIGIILLILAGLLFYNENESSQIFLYIAGISIISGLLLPIILKPIYIVWMVFAVILGWIMTRVILSLLFYIIMTPIGVVMRILGNDLLGLNKSNKESFSTRAILVQPIVELISNFLVFSIIGSN